MPIHLAQHNIYDIFHNGEYFVIITPNTQVKHIKLFNDRIFEYITLEIFGAIYVCKSEYIENIEITIDNMLVRTNVNRYPTFDNEIVMSSMVNNEDNYIIQWIKHYKRLGVTRFIIYDNSTNDSLKNILKDDDSIVLIKWTYPYYDSSGCIAHGQVCQINHAIYTLKSSKYIGFFDVDEYINPRTSEYRLNNIFDNILTQNNLQYDDIGSFRSLSKFFINKHNIPEEGCEFMKVFDCQDILQTGYEKHFVVPKNIDACCVHSIIKGKPELTVPTNIMFHNHYVFLNKISTYFNNIMFGRHKNGRGRWEPTTHTDTSIIRFYNMATKKIRVKLNGRLGNQLFQIAFSEYLKNHFQTDVTFETSHLPPEHLTYLSTVLNPWSHLIDSVPSNDIVEHNLHPQDWIKIIQDVPNSPILIHGYFQNYNYIPSNFVSKLQFPDTILTKYPDINNTVFIHIRGSDYRIPTHSWLHNVGLDEYYKQAIQMFPTDTKFSVFTDDIEYTTSQSFLKDISYSIIDENPVDSLFLMSKCSGGICANSSFSWWGAYLNPNRKLVLPSKWYNDPNLYTQGYYFQGTYVI